MQSWYLRFELARVKPSICFVVITLPLSAAGWYLSLTQTHTSLLPAQRTAYILAKDILKNALFPTYIDIYIYNFLRV